MKQDTLKQRFTFYMKPSDGRYEDLVNRGIFNKASHDIIAGFISAATIIPLAMGFAIVSGLHPAQGIAGGTVAALAGALFGGSKYLVYGSSAALIPIIGTLLTVYDTGFLVLASIIAGILLLISGLLKFGRITEKIPRSIAIGFTIGIVLIIVFYLLCIALGLSANPGYRLIDQLRFIIANAGAISIAAITMTVCTFLLCQAFKRISRFIPWPLAALVFGYLGVKTFWHDKGLVLLSDNYKGMTEGFFSFVSPSLPADWNTKTFPDLFFYTITIYIVVTIESSSAGRRADRLADNSRLPFDPHKELWGSGLINILSPLLNGLPQIGNWTATSINIRTGAVSPLSGIARFAFILLLATSLVIYIEKVPLACIAGVLLSVAFNKIKTREIKSVLQMGYGHFALMLCTGLMVLLLGVFTGMVSALLLYAIFFRRFDKKTNKVVARDKEMAL